MGEKGVPTWIHLPPERWRYYGFFSTPHTFEKKYFPPAHREGVRESGGVTPRIIKLGITWTKQ